jgi:hypothetical protein
MRRPFCLLILAAGLLLGTASVADAFPPNSRLHHQPVPVVTPGPRVAPRVFVAPQAQSLSFRSPYYVNPYYGAGFRSSVNGLSTLGVLYPFLQSWAGAGGGFGFNPFVPGWTGGFGYNPFVSGWYGGFGYRPGFFYGVNDPSGGNLFYSYPGYYFWPGTP